MNTRIIPIVIATLFFTQIADANRSQRIHNPQAYQSYQRYIDSKNPRAFDESGTDFALRKISLEVEQQLYGIMWNIVFATANTDDSYGPNAAKMLMPELISQMTVDASDGTLGEIAESIYEHLKREKEGR